MNLLSKTTTLLVILATFALSFFTCKKYPDDKGINLTKPGNRIGGRWTLKRILLNGNDITQQMNDSVANRDFEGIVLEVLGDYSQSDTPKNYYQTQLIINPNNGTRFAPPSSSVFEKNKDFEIRVDRNQYTFSPNDYNMPHDSIFCRHLNDNFKILRLQKNNFNLKANKTGITYEFTK